MLRKAMLGIATVGCGVALLLGTTAGAAGAAWKPLPKANGHQALKSAQAKATGTFTSSPAAGPVGTVLKVASVTPCPAASVAYVALVNPKTGTGFISDPLPAPIGPWSASLTIGSIVPPAAYLLEAACFPAASPDPTGVPTVAYVNRTFTVTAPPRPIVKPPSFVG